MTKLTPEGQKIWEKYISITSTLKQAQDFFKAYEVLVEENKKSPERPAIFHAHIVLLSFSVELLLKAVYYGLGIKKRGHNIKTLFNDLPDEIKQKLFEKFKTLLPTYTEELFDEMLVLHNDSFELWRYFHEKGSGNFNFQFCTTLANSIIKLLEETIDDMRPDLARLHSMTQTIA